MTIGNFQPRNVAFKAAICYSDRQKYGETARKLSKTENNGILVSFFNDGKTGLVFATDAEKTFLEASHDKKTRSETLKGIIKASSTVKVGELGPDFDKNWYC